jgi:hypothetical protein
VGATTEDAVEAAPFFFFVTVKKLFISAWDLFGFGFGSKELR